MQSIGIRALAVFFLRSLSAGLAVLVTFLVTRMIGAEQAGYYFYWTQLLMILIVVAGYGVPGLILRESSNSHFNIRPYFRKVASSALLLIAVLSLVSVFVPSLADKLLQAEGHSLLNSILLGLVLFGVFQLSAVQALFGSGRTVLGLVFQSAFLPIGMVLILLLVRPNDAATVFYGYAALFISVTFVAIATFLKICNVNQAKRAASIPSSANFYLIDLQSIFLSYGGLILASWFTDSTEFAALTIANSLAASVSLALISINLVMAPRFSRAARENDCQSLTRDTRSAIKLSAAIALPLLLFGAIFANQIFVFYSAELSTFGILLQAMLVGQAINVVTGPVLLLLRMSGNENAARRAGSYSCLWLLITVPLFSHFWGIEGAACALAGSVALQSLLGYASVVKQLGFHPISAVRA